MIDKNSCKLIICYNKVKLMIGVVRYDGLLDLSLSRDYRRKYAPYILLKVFNTYLLN